MPPVAPPTYDAYKAREADPARLPERGQRGEALAAESHRVWRANRPLYGAGKARRQPKREGVRVARCTVERLMRLSGLEGAVRGKRVRATIPVDPSGERPLDLVQRSFRAGRPNEPWVADFTDVAPRRGTAYAALVIGAFSRRIVA